MLNLLKNITIKWLQSIMEVIIFFPVILLFSLTLLPQNKLWDIMVSLTLYSLFGMILRRIFFTRMRFIAFFLGIPLVIFCNIYLFGTSIYLAASIPLSLIFFYRGIRSIERSWDRHFPIQLYWFGLSAYFLCYCQAYLMGYRQYLNIITYFGLFSVFAFLFINNQEQLITATMSEHAHTKIPKPILKNNRIFVCIIFLWLILLAQIKWIKSIVLFPIALILKVLNSMSVNDLMPRKTPAPLHQTGTGSNYWLFRLIDIAIQITGFLISMLLLIAVLIAFIKIIKGLTLWFLGLFKLNQTQESSLGYTDEKESLLDTTRISPRFNRLKSWLLKILEKEPKWEDLKENREKIRYIYRHFIIHYIAKGYNFKKHMTPNETFEDITKWDKRNTYKLVHLTVVYNKARYGTSEISDDEIENARKNFEHLKG